MKTATGRPDTTAFERAPFIAFWETTRACDLVCRHCRARAVSERNAGELSTSEAFSLLADIREMGCPVVVLTGGDPAKRPDLIELVRYGASIGLRMALTPSATPLMTRELLVQLRDAGLARIAISLDGASSTSHDSMEVDALIVATPAWAAANMFECLDDDFAESLASIEYSPHVSMSFAWRREQIPHAMDGTGFLVAPEERRFSDASAWPEVRRPLADSRHALGGPIRGHGMAKVRSHSGHCRSVNARRNTLRCRALSRCAAAAYLVARVCERRVSAATDTRPTVERR